MFTGIKRASALLLRPSYSYKARQMGIDTLNKIEIVNNNMKFITEKTDLYVIPHHPTLFIKGYKSLSINTDCQVVEFCFVERSSLPVNQVLRQSEFDQKWKDKISFSLNFDQLQNFLSMQPGKNSLFQVSYDNVEQNFKIEDNIPHKMMTITYKKEEQSNSSVKKSISFTEYINYEQFSLIQTILKATVYDLSGLRLIFDYKRRQQIQQLKNTIQNLNTKQQQTNSYYKSGDT